MLGATKHLSLLAMPRNATLECKAFSSSSPCCSLIYSSVLAGRISLAAAEGWENHLVSWQVDMNLFG